MLRILEEQKNRLSKLSNNKVNILICHSPIYLTNEEVLEIIKGFSSEADYTKYFFDGNIQYLGIIEDENSDKEFNREIEVSSSNLKSEIEFERGVKYCENEDFQVPVQ